jgi:hypothetical protein
MQTLKLVKQHKPAAQGQNAGFDDEMAANAAVWWAVSFGQALLSASAVPESTAPASGAMGSHPNPRSDI